jgi:hypothetical protein
MNDKRGLDATDARRFPTPLVAVQRDGCNGEGETWKILQTVNSDGNLSSNFFEERWRAGGCFFWMRSYFAAIKANPR